MVEQRTDTHMSSWVRTARIMGPLALVAGGGVAGVYLQGQFLGAVGILVGGCLAFAALFLTTPTCDRCGSPRVNRINSSPVKCGRCGHVHGDTTKNVVLTAPLDDANEYVKRPDGQRWLGTLRAFSLGVFLLGVGVVIYAMMGMTVPNALDPETWNAQNTWNILISIFGLALNTVGLMIYIISYKLA
jgi:hypothetical protein